MRSRRLLLIMDLQLETAKQSQSLTEHCETMLLALAANTTETKDDLLIDAAKLYKVDMKALRRETEKAEKEKTVKLKSAKAKQAKAPAKTKQVHN
jgi:hypothetical protein